MNEIRDNGRQERNENQSDSGSDTSEDEPFLDTSLKNLVVPLISKAHMISKDFFCAILAISVRHKLDYETMFFILKWAKVSSEFTNLLSTKTQMWKVLCRNESSIVRHMYCKNCKTFIGQNQVTQNCFCGKYGPGKNNSTVSYFLQVQIRSQLQEMFKDPLVPELLRYRFVREKMDNGAIEDKIDGAEYKKLYKPGGFLVTRIILLLLSTRMDVKLLIREIQVRGQNFWR